MVTVDDRNHAVLRLHRPGYIDTTDHIDGELLWVQAIARETSITVPLPIAGRDAQFVQQFSDDNGQKWSAVLFDFVPGDILESVANPSPYFREIGRTTAELHAHARSWNAPAGFVRFSWELTDMVGETSRWGTWENADMTLAEHAVLKEAERCALATLTTLAKSASTWGLIHSDLRPSNIMIDAGNLTVIDFDDAGFGWYLYDFASALSFIEHTDAAAAMAKDWVAGYREVLSLSVEDERLACALAMIRRLTMLGWSTTHRADALPTELFESLVSGSCLVADRYLASETWLLD
jgi:Ser/Thr protein kinase RdoA (MazF antagonist)